MKKNAGKIIGFLTGMVGFLLLFRILVLDRISPEDELAPGMVMLMALCSGVILAFLGSRLQSRVQRA